MEADAPDTHSHTHTGAPMDLTHTLSHSHEYEAMPQRTEGAVTAVSAPRDAELPMEVDDAFPDASGRGSSGSPVYDEDGGAEEDTHTHTHVQVVADTLSHAAGVTQGHAHGESPHVLGGDTLAQDAQAVSPTPVRQTEMPWDNKDTGRPNGDAIRVELGSSNVLPRRARKKYGRRELHEFMRALRLASSAGTEVTTEERPSDTERQRARTNRAAVLSFYEDVLRDKVMHAGQKRKRHLEITGQLGDEHAVLSGSEEEVMDLSRALDDASGSESSDSRVIARRHDVAAYPEALRSRAREKFVHPADFTADFARLVPLVNSGDLHGVMSAWKHDMLPFYRALDENERSHPLLHAVHKFQPDIVAFFVAVGCKIHKRGSVHPYSGDNLSSEAGVHVGTTPRQLWYNLRKFNCIDGSSKKIPTLLHEIERFLDDDERLARQHAVAHLCWLQALYERGADDLDKPALAALRKQHYLPFAFSSGPLPSVSSDGHKYWEGADAVIRQPAATTAGLSAPAMQGPSLLMLAAATSAPPGPEPVVNAVTSGLVGNTVDPAPTPGDDLYHPAEVSRDCHVLINAITLANFECKVAARDDISVVVWAIRKMLEAFAAGSLTSLTALSEATADDFPEQTIQGTPAKLEAAIAELTACGAVQAARSTMTCMQAMLARFKPPRCQRDSPDHPLLHAVHRLRPAVVDLLLRLGFSADVSGTSHPYCGDDCSVAELQRVTPRGLVAAFATRSSMFGRGKRRVFNDVAKLIEAAPVAADVVQNAEIEAVVLPADAEAGRKHARKPTKGNVLQLRKRLATARARATFGAPIPPVAEKPAPARSPRLSGGVAQPVPQQRRKCAHMAPTVGRERHQRRRNSDSSSSTSFSDSSNIGSSSESTYQAPHRDGHVDRSSKPRKSRRPRTYFEEADATDVQDVGPSASPRRRRRAAAAPRLASDTVPWWQRPSQGAPSRRHRRAQHVAGEEGADSDDEGAVLAAGGDAHPEYAFRVDDPTFDAGPSTQERAWYADLGASDTGSSTSDASSVRAPRAAASRRRSRPTRVFHGDTLVDVKVGAGVGKGDAILHFVADIEATPPQTRGSRSMLKHLVMTGSSSNTLRRRTPASGTSRAHAVRPARDMQQRLTHVMQTGRRQGGAPAFGRQSTAALPHEFLSPSMFDAKGVQRTADTPARRREPSDAPVTTTAQQARGFVINAATINRERAELERILARINVLLDMQRLLETHAAKTGSPPGTETIAEWARRAQEVRAGSLPPSTRMLLQHAVRRPTKASRGVLLHDLALEMDPDQGEERPVSTAAAQVALRAPALRLKAQLLQRGREGRIRNRELAEETHAFAPAASGRQTAPSPVTLRALGEPVSGAVPPIALPELREGALRLDLREPGFPQHAADAPSASASTPALPVRIETSEPRPLSLTDILPPDEVAQFLHAPRQEVRLTVPLDMFHVVPAVIPCLKDSAIVTVPSIWLDVFAGQAAAEEEGPGSGTAADAPLQALPAALLIAADSGAAVSKSTPRDALDDALIELEHTFDVMQALEKLLRRILPAYMSDVVVLQTRAETETSSALEEARASANAVVGTSAAVLKVLADIAGSKPDLCADDCSWATQCLELVTSSLAQAFGVHVKGAEELPDADPTIRLAAIDTGRIVLQPPVWLPTPAALHPSASDPAPAVTARAALLCMELDAICRLLPHASSEMAPFDALTDVCAGIAVSAFIQLLHLLCDFPALLVAGHGPTKCSQPGLALLHATVRTMVTIDAATTRGAAGRGSTPPRPASDMLLAALSGMQMLPSWAAGIAFEDAVEDDSARKMRNAHPLAMTLWRSAEVHFAALTLLRLACAVQPTYPDALRPGNDVTPLALASEALQARVATTMAEMLQRAATEDVSGMFPVYFPSAATDADLGDTAGAEAHAAALHALASFIQRVASGTDLDAIAERSIAASKRSNKVMERIINGFHVILRPRSARPASLQTSAVGVCLRSTAAAVAAHGWSHRLSQVFGSWPGPSCVKPVLQSIYSLQALLCSATAPPASAFAVFAAHQVHANGAAPVQAVVQGLRPVQASPLFTAWTAFRSRETSEVEHSCMQAAASLAHLPGWATSAVACRTSPQRLADPASTTSERGWPNTTLLQMALQGVEDSQRMAAEEMHFLLQLAFSWSVEAPHETSAVYSIHPALREMLTRTLEALPKKCVVRMAASDDFGAKARMTVLPGGEHTAPKFASHAALQCVCTAAMLYSVHIGPDVRKFRIDRLLNDVLDVERSDAAARALFVQLVWAHAFMSLVDWPDHPTIVATAVDRLWAVGSATIADIRVRTSALSQQTPKAEAAKREPSSACVAAKATVSSAMPAYTGPAPQMFPHIKSRGLPLGISSAQNAVASAPRDSKRADSAVSTVTAAPPIPNEPWALLSLEARKAWHATLLHHDLCVLQLIADAVYTLAELQEKLAREGKAGGAAFSTRLMGRAFMSPLVAPSKPGISSLSDRAFSLMTVMAACVRCLRVPELPEEAARSVRASARQAGLSVFRVLEALLAHGAAEFAHQLRAVSDCLPSEAAAAPTASSPAPLDEYDLLMSNQDALALLAAAEQASTSWPRIEDAFTGVLGSLRAVDDGAVLLKRATAGGPESSATSGHSATYFTPRLAPNLLAALERVLLAMLRGAHKSASASGGLVYAGVACLDSDRSRPNCDMSMDEGEAAVGAKTSTLTCVLRLLARLWQLEIHVATREQGAAGTLRALVAGLRYAARLSTIAAEPGVGARADTCMWPTSLEMSHAAVQSIAELTAAIVAVVASDALVAACCHTHSSWPMLCIEGLSSAEAWTQLCGAASRSSQALVAARTAASPADTPVRGGLHALLSALAPIAREATSSSIGAGLQRAGAALVTAMGVLLRSQHIMAPRDMIAGSAISSAWVDRVAQACVHAAERCEGDIQKWATALPGLASHFHS